MQQHDLTQGSPEWAAFRLEHHGASEAAAMLGLSKNIKRSELLRAKHTKVPREFSDWVQANVLDHGHAVEALARPLAEAVIGAELFPVTCSNGKLSASCDGLTFDGETAWEHKQWSAALVKWIEDHGTVPEEHMPQCQQVIMCSGAKQLMFTVSDGTEENMVHVWVEPNQAWFARLRAGWDQFDSDLAAYEPPAASVPVVAAPTEHLPAPSVKLDGALSVVSNLQPFGLALRAFVDRIPKKPSTDQEFADTEAACKRLKDAEDALDAAESGALASISDVELMRRMVAELRELARNTRLASEKMVAARKQEIRAEIVADSQGALDGHVAGLNKRLGAAWIPRRIGPFAEAIKGKRTLDSLRDAVSTALANSKIELSALADRMGLNHKSLVVEGKDWSFLFADFAAVGAKPAEDFGAIVAQRIQKFKEDAERAKAAAAPAAQPVAAPVAAAPPATSEAPAGPPISTGEIGKRLGFVLQVSFIEEVLGIKHSAQDKRAMLWNESQWPEIKSALIKHIEELA